MCNFQMTFIVFEIWLKFSVKVKTCHTISLNVSGRHQHRDRITHHTRPFTAATLCYHLVPGYNTFTLHKLKHHMQLAGNGK